MQLPNNALTSKLLGVAVKAVTVLESSVKALGDAISQIHLPEKVVTSQLFRVGVKTVTAGLTVAAVAGLATGVAALGPAAVAIGGCAALAVAGAVGGYIGSRLLIDSNAQPGSTMLLRTGVAAGACGLAAALIGVAGFIFAPPVAAVAAGLVALGEAGVGGFNAGQVVVERVGYVPEPAAEPPADELQAA
jgi:hypothetical protein